MCIVKFLCSFWVNESDGLKNPKNRHSIPTTHFRISNGMKLWIKHQAPHINERNVTIIARKSRQMGSIAIAAWKTNVLNERKGMITKKNNNNNNTTTQHSNCTWCMTVVLLSRINCEAYDVFLGWRSFDVGFLLCISLNYSVKRKRVFPNWQLPVKMGRGFKDFVDKCSSNHSWMTFDLLILK